MCNLPTKLTRNRHLTIARVHAVDKGYLHTSRSMGCTQNNVLIKGQDDHNLPMHP